MEKNSYQSKVIKQIELRLNIVVVGYEYPKQGADGFVMFLYDQHGNDYAVKVGEVENDYLAYNLIIESKVNVPIPTVIDYFIIEDLQVIVSERVKYPLYNFISTSHKNAFIPDLIDKLLSLREIESNYSGFVSWADKKMSWEQFLAFKYSGLHPWYPWDEIVNRKGVDTKLVKDSIENLVKSLSKFSFGSREITLLHTDINQNNIFVDIKNKTITGIIDWSESTFGDYLFDLSRLRLNIWHNFNKDALNIYYNKLKLTYEEKALEDLYFKMHVVDYINWYTESNDTKRLNMHLEYLKSVKWS